MSESNNKLHHHHQQQQQQQTSNNQININNTSGFSSISNNNNSNNKQGNNHTNFTNTTTSTNYNNTITNTSKPTPTIPFVNFNRRDPPQTSNNNNNNSNNMECTSLTHLYVKKGYVQRDYSRGTKIRFETTLPSELENFISQSEFAQFIDELNDIYADAEKLKFCEGCMACLTAYLLYCCIETHKQKCMRRAGEFIANQNDIWKDRGITVFDPMTRGFRILELQVHTNSRPQ